MKLLYTILFLLASYVASAQTGEVHGTVFDEKKQPITGAVVEAWQGGIVKGCWATEPDGVYWIKPLDAGVYDVVVTYPQYAKVTITKITVGRLQVEQNITMLPATDSLKEITLKWKKSLISKQPEVGSLEYETRRSSLNIGMETQIESLRPTNRKERKQYRKVQRALHRQYKHTGIGP